jgi:signal transduction histidine kinase
MIGLMQQEELGVVPRRWAAPVMMAGAAGLLWWTYFARPAGHLTPLNATGIAGSSAAMIISLGVVYLRLWPSRRLVRTLAQGVLAGSSLLLLALEPGGPGAAGVFMTAIWASGTGRLGIMIAALTGAGYLAVLLHASEGRASVSLATNAVGYLAALGLSALMRHFRREQLERAATAERERLAREIHDVLAHTLSALTVQLEAARLLARQRPGDPRVGDAVDRAHRLAREGLEEARRAVGALRGESLPGPELLGRLAAGFERDTGIRCTLRVEGATLPLKPDGRLAIYRTAQEALTNVRKHAEATEVSVQLTFTDRGAELTVANLGRARPSHAASGFGLIGLRERAELLGGRLEAGPTAGGFRVKLWVPV